jgi:hypothetical protein
MKTATNDTVTRIPPSSDKPKRRRSFGSASSTSNSIMPQKKKANVLELFSKLNPNDAVHARRIQQRRKDVSKGKNTVGYTEYLKNVPKEKRRPRNLDTPASPDPTNDMSNKRWQGQIKAW